MRHVQVIVIVIHTESTDIITTTTIIFVRRPLLSLRCLGWSLQNLGLCEDCTRWWRLDRIHLACFLCVHVDNVL